MGWTNQSVRSLTIPTGAGPGTPRIVIDGTTGRIDVYDADGLVGTLDSGGLTIQSSERPTSYIQISSEEGEPGISFNPGDLDNGTGFFPGFMYTDVDDFSDPNSGATLFITTPGIDGSGAPGVIALAGPSLGFPASVMTFSSTIFFVTGDAEFFSDLYVDGNEWETWTGVQIQAGGGSPTIGDATTAIRWHQFGRTVHVSGRITFGSSTNLGTGTAFITLPVAARSTDPSNIGHGWIYDSSGTARQIVSCQLDSVNRFFLMTYNGAFISSAVPWPWGTPDQIRFNLTYEAAS